MDAFKLMNEIDDFWLFGRCRVCAKQVSGNCFDPEDLCQAHGHEANNFEAQLGALCVQLQDELLLQLEIDEFSDGEILAPQAPINATVNALYRRATILEKQCEISLVRLLPDMEMVEGLSEIAQVEEMKFRTGAYYNYIHCAWKITLVDGQCFVFDPTGIQFGADWALLIPWDK